MRYVFRVVGWFLCVVCWLLSVVCCALICFCSMCFVVRFFCWLFVVVCFGYVSVVGCGCVVSCMLLLLFVIEIDSCLCVDWCCSLFVVMLFVLSFGGWCFFLCC